LGRGTKCHEGNETGGDWDKGRNVMKETKRVVMGIKEEVS